MMARPPVKQRISAHAAPAVNNADGPASVLSVVIKGIGKAINTTRATRTAALTKSASQTPGYVNIPGGASATDTSIPTGTAPNVSPPTSRSAPRARNQVGTTPVPSLAYGTPLTGSAATVWSVAILKSLNAPITTSNIGSLNAWYVKEGGGGQNNPLNTTLSTSATTSTINSDGVKGYSTPAAGVSATSQTLNGGYPAIVAALKSGKGLGSDPTGAIAADLRKWAPNAPTSYYSITPTSPGKIPSGVTAGNSPSGGVSSGVPTGSSNVPAGGTSTGASGYGGTRPGGGAIGPTGPTGSNAPADTGQGVQALFADYENELTMSRVAPSDTGVTGPFKWWLNSFTNQWNEEQGGQ